MEKEKPEVICDLPMTFLAYSQLSESKRMETLERCSGYEAICFGNVTRLTLRIDKLKENNPSLRPYRGIPGDWMYKEAEDDLRSL